MRPELVFFIAFSLLGTKKIVHFLVWNLILKYYFCRKYFNLEKNYTKTEQISRVHTKLRSTITPRKKRKSKKFFNFVFYAGPAF